MNERIIDIILYLINKIRKDSPIESIDMNGLSSDGYTDAEIGAAFSWIADRAALGAGMSSSTGNRSFRILHETERKLFKAEAYGYLLLFTQIGLLDDIDFEMIVNRAGLAEFHPLGIEDVKEMVSILLAESGDLSFGGSRLMLNLHDTIH